MVGSSSIAEIVGLTCVYSSNNIQVIYIQAWIFTLMLGEDKFNFSLKRYLAKTVSDRLNNNIFFQLWKMRLLK